MSSLSYTSAVPAVAVQSSSAHTLAKQGEAQGPSLHHSCNQGWVYSLLQEQGGRHIMVSDGGSGSCCFTQTSAMHTAPVPDDSVLPGPSRTHFPGCLKTSHVPSHQHHLPLAKHSNILSAIMPETRRYPKESHHPCSVLQLTQVMEVTNLSGCLGVNSESAPFTGNSTPQTEFSPPRGWR